MKLDQYLMTNPQYISKIQVLIKKFVITEAQKALLPPICMNPVSSTFDITLLSCLLRNICGLKSSSDTVWTTPAQTDTSLEADITRLRLCRNKLGHSGTVLIPQAQLDTDWKELCQIMVSLNSKLTNGVANLQGEIAKAETMEIDENLNKLHEETLKLWDEMDKAWDHGLAEISETLQRIELNQSMLNERLVQDNEKLHEGLGSVNQTIKAFEGKLDKHLLQSPQESQEDKLNAAARELQKDLVHVYKKDCSMLPISPMIEEEEIDLFSIYSDPSFVHSDHYKLQNDSEKCPISSYEEIFQPDGTDCVKVYISYCEFLAALYICSFDKQNDLDLIVQGWTKLKDFLQFDNFYVLLSGLSFEKVEYLFQKLYLNLSDELELCRKMAVHDIHDVYYNEQSLLLQNITLKCIKEGRTCTKRNVVLRLDNNVIGNNTENKLIKELLVYHMDSVKSIHSMNGEYFDEFSNVRNLGSLILEDISPSRMDDFISCICRSKSSLHTLGISSSTHLRLLPISDLAALTSISLCYVKMKHEDFEQFINCLSVKAEVEVIKFSQIECTDHYCYETDCAFSLNLVNMSKINTLVLYNVNIYCKELNGSNMNYIRLFPQPSKLDIHFTELYESLQCSQLQYLNISCTLNENSAKLFTTAVKSLRQLKLLRLNCVQLFDCLLQIHADVTDLNVILYDVILSKDSFYAFIVSTVKCGSVTSIQFGKSVITDGENQVSSVDSVDYVSKYITSFDWFRITYQHGYWIHFEPKNKQ